MLNIDPTSKAIYGRRCRLPVWPKHWMKCACVQISSRGRKRFCGKSRFVARESRPRLSTSIGNHEIQILRRGKSRTVVSSLMLRNTKIRQNSPSLCATYAWCGVYHMEKRMSHWNDRNVRVLSTRHEVPECKHWKRPEALEQRGALPRGKISPTMLSSLQNTSAQRRQELSTSGSEVGDGTLGPGAIDINLYIQTGP